MRSRSRSAGHSERCCIRDGGAGPLGWWSSVAALRGEAANHRKLLRSRAVVVSVAGKVAPLSAAGMGQEGERERTTDEVSKGTDEIETGLPWMARDEPGGYPSSAQVVSGIEVARAWSGLWCGTCEPVVPCWYAASGAVVARGRCRQGEPRAAETAKGLSTDAGHRGGPSRGSCEAW